jgi:tRNA-dihydrouridine synthase
MEKYFDSKLALLESRSHIMFFLKGERNATQFKIEIMKAGSMPEVYSLLDKFYK